MSREPTVLLESPVTSDDHSRGPERASVTLVEYGDFECPYCGRAEPVVKELLQRFGDVLRLVFRHTPRSYAHAHAQLAAEAAEAAGAQGKFWEMHDRLFQHQNQLSEGDLAAHAAAIGLDVQRFTQELGARTYAPRVHAQAASGAHTVLATPTFFINGVRFDQTPDFATMEAAIERALRSPRGEMRSARSESGTGKFEQRIVVGPHRLIGDQPVEVGGTEHGPSPHDFLAVALASCTAMTIRYAADRRGWSVTHVSVDVRQWRQGALHNMHRRVSIEGDLTAEQRDALLAISARCPVAVTLTGEIAITSELVSRAPDRISAYPSDRNASSG